MSLNAIAAALVLQSAVAPAPAAGDPPGLTILRCFERAARIEYILDEQDLWQSPEETAHLGRGDCEDKALYLQDLLRCEEISAEVVFGVIDWDSSHVMHAWVELTLEGELYLLDPTQGFIGRRRQLSSGSHVPIIGMPNVLRRIRAYSERTGRTAINAYYEHQLAIAGANGGTGDRLAER